MVSIIIPCRNEEKFIGRCLESLIAQDLPPGQMEILAVNGASEDGTEKVIHSYTEKYSFIKLLQNPKKYTPISMNVGLKNAVGEAVMIIGAHSELEPSYVQKCLHYLDELKADAVGGTIFTRPAVPTLTAKAIAAALTSFFGTGGSRFRTKRGGSIQESDTAFNACYHKDVFDRIGFFNENLLGSQDFELNIRLRKAGGKIFLIPDIAANYYPKTTFGAFFKHNIKDGIWAILPMKYGAPPFKLRHLLPLFFVSGLILPLIISVWLPLFIWLTVAGLAAYFAASLFFSVRIARTEKNFLLAPFLVTAFAARHFGYGIGSLIGLIRLVSRK